jgi:uncharacterized protein
MKVILRVIGVVAGVCLAASGWATHMLTRKGIKATIDSAFFYTPFELGVPFEAVSFYNSEGLALKGWWLDRPATRKVVILCPGYGRSKSDLLGVGSRLWRAGYNVLLFDFRDQGESETSISTIGHFERDDLDAAIDYVIWRLPGAEIGLVGYSMGAAASIMVAATRPEVRAVVADSSFATLRGVLRRIFRGLTHLPASPSMEIAEMLIWLRAGYRVGSVRPIDYIDRIAPRPILIIHGDCDILTPVADAHALYEAAGEPKELWITAGSGHCGAYFLDRQAYVDRVVLFFERSLGAPESDIDSAHIEQRLGAAAAK